MASKSLQQSSILEALSRWENFCTDKIKMQHTCKQADL